MFLLLPVYIILPLTRIQAIAIGKQKVEIRELSWIRPDNVDKLREMLQVSLGQPGLRGPHWESHDPEWHGSGMMIPAPRLWPGVLREGLTRAEAALRHPSRGLFGSTIKTKWVTSKVLSPLSLPCI